MINIKKVNVRLITVLYSRRLKQGTEQYDKRSREQGREVMSIIDNGPHDELVNGHYGNNEWEERGRSITEL